MEDIYCDFIMLKSALQHGKESDMETRNRAVQIKSRATGCYLHSRWFMII